MAMAVATRHSQIIIANSGDQTVSALDAHSGATLATIPLGQSPTALALDETRGRVFTLNTCMASLARPRRECPGETSSVSVLDLHNDTLIDTVSVGSGATAIAADDRTGRVFVAYAYDDKTNLLDSNGHTLGTVGLDGNPLEIAVDAPRRHVFIGTRNPFARRSSVSMIDSTTGALLNTVRLGRYVGNVLSDARAGRVLVSCDGDVYLLDARTGRALRRLPGADALLAVDEREGHALVSDRGHLRLIATRDGASVGSIRGQGALNTLSIEAVAVDEAAGRFYLATPGRLFVLDGRSGRVVRALSLQGIPMDMSVDAAAHRVFIVNHSTTDVPARRPGRPQLVQWLHHTLPWLPLPTAPPPTASGTLTVLDTTRL